MCYATVRGSTADKVRNGCELLRQKIAQMDRSGFGQSSYQEAPARWLPPTARVGGSRQIVKVEVPNERVSGIIGKPAPLSLARSFVRSLVRSLARSRCSHAMPGTRRGSACSHF